MLGCCFIQYVTICFDLFSIILFFFKEQLVPFIYLFSSVLLLLDQCG